MHGFIFYFCDDVDYDMSCNIGFISALSDGLLLDEICLFYHHRFYRKERTSSLNDAWF